MFNSFRLRACALRRDKQTLKPNCFGSRVVLTSLSSYRWFTARRPAQTRTRSPCSAMPPADNSTGCYMLSLSSFQRTDCRQATRGDPSASPRIARIGTEADRFWGNLLRLLQRFLSVNLCGIYLRVSSFVEAKKIAPLGTRSNNRQPRRTPPTRNDLSGCQYTRPGWESFPFNVSTSAVIG